MVLLVAVASAGLASAQMVGESLEDTNGLVGEYFLQLDSSQMCRQGNGSSDVLGGQLPNLTRVDAALMFPDTLSFSVDRCVWEPDSSGNQVWLCRGGDVARERFAVRWTGFLQVWNSGDYSFEVEVDGGGARLVIGHAQCPHPYVCGTADDVLNSRFQDLQYNFQNDGTYGRHCPLCETGIYDTCWVTPNGCEPFNVWHLEADGAGSAGAAPGASCSAGPATRSGTRYLRMGLHPIRVEYFKRDGNARLMLRYKGPDTGNGAFINIPARMFIFPRGKTLRSDWFQLPAEVGDTIRSGLPAPGTLGTAPPGSHFLFSKEDTMLGMGPNEGAFSEEVDALGVSLFIRWTGYLKIEEAGRYTFTLESDDGSRLVLGGRGGDGEIVVVDNDGMKSRVITATGEVDLLAGLHPLRLEYFRVPVAVTVGSVAVPTPPALVLLFSGADTGQVPRRVATSLTTPFQRADDTCEMRHWAWGGGMSMTRDCTGTCFDARERLVGDGICDEGPDGSITPKLHLRCPSYGFDGGDCERGFGQVLTTTAPPLSCYSSCPAGDWLRRSCTRCTAGRSAGLCEQRHADGCSGCLPQVCCVAHVTGIEGRGSDCIAFGSHTNCTDGLARLLVSMQQEPLSLDWLAAGFSSQRPRPLPSGTLLRVCDSPLCNTFPRSQADLPSEAIGLECPANEDPQPGVACYDGPWDVFNIQDPRVECQDGSYSNNFCLTRRTTIGEPFVRCCAFAYLTPQSRQECRFLGLPRGGCTEYLALLEVELGKSQFTLITNTLVLTDCTGDLCNDPVELCSKAVDSNPWQTRFITTTLAAGQLPDRESLMVGGIELKEEGTSPALVIGIVAGCVVLCLGGVGLWYATRQPPPPVFHSEKAKVVSDSTWVEPEQCEDTGEQYGVVKPRPMAYTMLMAPKVKPLGVKALKLDPPTIVEGQPQLESADAVFDLERSPTLPPPPPADQRPLQLRDAAAPDATAGPAALPPPLAAAPLMPAAELPGTAIEAQGPAGESESPVVRPHLALGAAPQAQLAWSLSDGTPTVGALEGATAGRVVVSVPVPVPEPHHVLPPSRGPLVLGRPAAAARMMRQGIGPPRVAT